MGINPTSSYPPTPQKNLPTCLSILFCNNTSPVPHYHWKDHPAEDSRKKVAIHTQCSQRFPIQLVHNEAWRDPVEHYAKQSKLLWVWLNNKMQQCMLTLETHYSPEFMSNVHNLRQVENSDRNNQLTDDLGQNNVRLRSPYKVNAIRGSQKSLTKYTASAKKTLKFI